MDNLGYLTKTVFLPIIIGMTINAWVFSNYLSKRAESGYVHSDAVKAYTKILVTTLVAVVLCMIAVSITTVKVYSATVIKQSSERIPLNANNIINNLANDSEVGYVVKLKGSDRREFVVGSKDYHGGDTVEVIKITDPILGDISVFETDI